MNVKDKVAMLTGASSGIGLATAKLLTNCGAKVARSKVKLEHLSKELAGSFVKPTDKINPRITEACWALLLLRITKTGAKREPVTTIFFFG